MCLRKGYYNVFLRHEARGTVEAVVDSDSHVVAITLQCHLVELWVWVELCVQATGEALFGLNDMNNIHKTTAPTTV